MGADKCQHQLLAVSCHCVFRCRHNDVRVATEAFRHRPISGLSACWARKFAGKATGDMRAAGVGDPRHQMRASARLEGRLRGKWDSNDMITGGIERYPVNDAPCRQTARFDQRHGLPASMTPGSGAEIAAQMLLDVPGVTKLVGYCVIDGNRRDYPYSTPVFNSGSRGIRKLSKAQQRCNRHAIRLQTECRRDPLGIPTPNFPGKNSISFFVAVQYNHLAIDLTTSDVGRRDHD